MTSARRFSGTAWASTDRPMLAAASCPVSAVQAGLRNVQRAARSVSKMTVCERSTMRRWRASLSRTIPARRLRCASAAAIGRQIANTVAR